jgi:hypothetical protein
MGGRGASLRVVTVVTVGAAQAMRVEATRRSGRAVLRGATRATFEYWTDDFARWS